MTKKIYNITCGFLLTYVIFGFALLVFAIVYSGSSDGDTLEHVHTSWLISTGKIPYKDFFQHHNPLLWYLGAPVVHLFEYSLRAVDAANCLAVISTMILAYYCYAINRDFLSNKLGGLIAAAFVIFAHESLFEKDFKPDNFMTMSLVSGVYYLFLYLKDKRLVSLAKSFMLFFIGFMFTQKAVLFLMVVGLTGIYLVVNKDVKLTDALYAGILPLMIYCSFLAFLYSEGVFLLYFKANFELNSHIPAVFFTRRYISPSLEMMVPLLLSFLALLKMGYSGNKYVKIMCVLFGGEYIIRLYYFTPFVYYFALLHALASILAGAVLAELALRYKLVLYGVMVYFLTLGGIYAHMYSYRITIGDEYKYGASGYVLSLTNRCDYVVNGFRFGYNLFGKDIDFIWNLLGQIDVIAATIGIRKTADLEALIKEKRPKIISGSHYYDRYMEYRGAIEVYPVHLISQHLLDTMYNPLPRDGLYILKPEYQSYDCRYNPRTKSYEYYDFK